MKSPSEFSPAKIAPWLYVASWYNTGARVVRSGGYDRLLIFHAPNPRAAGLARARVGEHEQSSMHYFACEDGDALSPDEIRGCMEGADKILVMCRRGQSRSASAAVGALVWKGGLSLDEALAQVQRALVAFYPALNTLASLFPDIAREDLRASLRRLEIEFNDLGNEEDGL